jgi:hypothetical protein
MESSDPSDPGAFADKRKAVRLLPKVELLYRPFMGVSADIPV